MTVGILHETFSQKLIRTVAVIINIVTPSCVRVKISRSQRYGDRVIILRVNLIIMMDRTRIRRDVHIQNL